MKIAHYVPNEFHTLFRKELPQHTFMNNKCDASVDIIFCGSVSQLKHAVPAKEKYSKPLICWVWDIPYNWREWSDNPASHEANKHRDVAVNRTISILKDSCDLVMSASKSTQNVLKEQFGISSTQLYFYIDTHSIDSIQPQMKKNQIVQASRYFYNKRFEDTLQAMKGLSASLVCTGYGDAYMKTLRKQATDIGLAAQFHTALPRSSVIQLVKTSSVLVSPSVFEGWGMTPIEALCGGTAVLLSDLDVFKEVYGDTVVYHKRKDPWDMHEKLKVIVSNQGLRERIITGGRKRISEFTVEKFAKRWEKIINE